MIDILLFFSVYILSFSCIAGYGIILNKYIYKDNFHKNNFQLCFDGFLLLLILSFLIYLFLDTNKYFNVFLLIFGLIIFIKHQKFQNKIKQDFLFLSLFFVGLLISKSHDDFVLYHFLHLKELTEVKLQLGLANLSPRYAYSSIFTYIQIIFYVPYFGFKLFHLPSFLIFVSLLGHLYHLINDKKQHVNNKIFYSTLLLFCILKFTRLSEFGYDYVAQFILLYLFVQIIDSNYFLFREKLKLINYFIFAICVKITSILFFPIIFLLYNKNIFKNLLSNLKKNFLVISLLFFLIFTIIGNSFIKTGCVFYPLNNTCLNKKIVSWSIDKNELKKVQNIVIYWAKSFAHQSKDKSIEKEIYLKNFNWVDNWINQHFFYKIFEHLLIFIFYYLIILFLIGKNFTKYNFSTKKIVLFGLSSLSILLWFSLIPQLRFGSTVIIIFIYSLLNLFSKNVQSISIKNFKIVFVITLLLFNIKNIDRINKELNRSDENKYTNFPWFYEPTLIRKSDCLYSKYKCDNPKIKVRKTKHYNIISLKD